MLNDPGILTNPDFSGLADTSFLLALYFTKLVSSFRIHKSTSTLQLAHAL